MVITRLHGLRIGRNIHQIHRTDLPEPPRQPRTLYNSQEVDKNEISKLDQIKLYDEREKKDVLLSITSMILDNFEIDEIKQVDLPVNYKFENTIEFLLKIYSNLNTFEINEDKVIYKTTIQCLLEKKKYKGFDPDELLDSIQNKIKLEGFSSDKINETSPPLNE